MILLLRTTKHESQVKSVQDHTVRVCVEEKAEKSYTWKITDKAEREREGKKTYSMYSNVSCDIIILCLKYWADTRNKEFWVKTLHPQDPRTNI